MNIHLYIKVLRPVHWIKNVFTLLGIFAAFIQYDLKWTLEHALLALVSLVLACAISSVNYIVNEILDSPHDARHPKKSKRPIPSGRVKVWKLVVTASILLALSIIAAGTLFSPPFTLWLLALFIAGLIYNVRPIRAKDIPYIDVISESINNPIRLLIGWYSFNEIQAFPPLSLILAFWIFGAYMMTAKRLAELRELRFRAISYRPTFSHYTQKGLTLVYILYGVLSLTLFIQIALQYQKRLLYALPLFIVFLAWFTKLTFEKNSIVTGPEYLYRRPLFFCYSLFFLIATLTLILF